MKLYIVQMPKRQVLMDYFYKHIKGIGHRAMLGNPGARAIVNLWDLQDRHPTKLNRLVMLKVIDEFRKAQWN